MQQVNTDPFSKT